MFFFKLNFILFDNKGILNHIICQPRLSPFRDILKELSS